MRLRLLASSILFSLLAGAATGAPRPGQLFEGRFEPVTTFAVDGQVAEIVDATPNGRTLVYTDSESERIGFVDIGDPEAPVQFATLDMGGVPTSVAITPHGRWALVCVAGPNDLAVVKMATREIVRRIPLFGQPDSIDVDALGFHAVIAIENEREDGEAEMPHGDPGFLVIVDMFGSPDRWTTRDVHLTGIANRFPTDPEPEYVAIHGNVAAVTLQENNHVVLVRISHGEIIGDFEAGTTTHAADLQEDDQISFTDTLTNARREPDAIAWTPKGRLVTANEGDYDLDLADGEFVGGRDFTIFRTSGSVLFEPGAALEEAGADAGLYPDDRSENRGSEPEGVEVAWFWFHSYLFVGAERGNFVGVYRLDDESNPEFVQILPTGDRPEGLLAIPHRGLFVTANEGDGTISIFRFAFD